MSKINIFEDAKCAKTEGGGAVGGELQLFIGSVGQRMVPASNLHCT